MAPHTYVVVGSSRGIGHELVQQLSQDSSNHVIATVRKPLDFGKSNVETLVLDQSDSESVEEAASKIKSVDTLILNAAMGDNEKLLETTPERLQEYMNNNVVGVHRVVRALLPALRASQTKKLIIISSTSGSMATVRDKQFGFQGPYSVSKAANNMQMVQYHNELHRDGFIVVAVHPGWVATDMGKIAGDGAMPIPESVEGILKTVKELKSEDSGKFFKYDGTDLPW